MQTHKLMQSVNCFHHLADPRAPGSKVSAWNVRMKANTPRKP